jgi:nicotinamidase/pyrazinamidase
MDHAITSDDVLLVIDMQNDFLPGGSLAVADGDTIIPGINALARRFQHVLLTQDWHPQDHISFGATHGLQPFTTIEAPYGTQALWPVHCVQGSRGADLHPGLDIPHAELLLRKGCRSQIDSYSAFLENDGTTPTGLKGYLNERGLRRLFFVGVAYDFCVGSSAIDGMKLGFDCTVIEDLTRAVGLPATGTTLSSVSHIEQNFAAAGVTTIAARKLSAEE